MYFDNLITGGESVKQGLEAKQTAQTIFNEATFELHKCQSNVRNLKPEEGLVRKVRLTPSSNWALRKVNLNCWEFLGIKRKIQVSFPMFAAEPTKRGVLAKIA